MGHVRIFFSLQLVSWNIAYLSLERLETKFIAQYNACILHINFEHIKNI